MAYFYFDFRDIDKQHWRDLLLSTQSSACCDILHSGHGDGAQHPNLHVLFYSISPAGHGSHFQIVRRLIRSSGRRCGIGVKGRSKTSSPFLAHFHENLLSRGNIVHFHFSRIFV